MIGATILFTIAGIILLFSIIACTYTNTPEWLLLTIISLVLSAAGVVTLTETPRNAHVRKGKAHYIEQNHVEVLNGDTINTYKTYQIVWTENSK
jgi:hypothetical protein